MNIEDIKTYLNGKTSDSRTQGMAKLLKQVSMRNKTKGKISFLSVKVCISQEKTVEGRLVLAQTLRAILQQAVPSMEPMTSFLLPMVLTMMADKIAVAMKSAPITTWNQNDIYTYNSSFLGYLFMGGKSSNYLVQLFEISFVCIQSII